MNRVRLVGRALSRSLGFRVGLFGLLGVVAILGAMLVDPLVPDGMAERFGQKASLVGLLTILASSLLAVATFSLGAMVTAYTSLSTSATPRTEGLVVSDPQTQTSLATFAGGFLYAIVGLAALGPGLLDAAERSFLFFVTLAMIGVVAWTLVRWIALLGKIARVGHAVAEVERITTEQIVVEARSPHRGALAALPSYVEGQPVATLPATRSCFVRNVDLEAAQVIAADLDCVVEVVVRPAELVLLGDPVLRVHGARAVEAVSRLDDCLSTATTRSYDGDPRHGLVVLGEIGAKALSPGVNDPGTAIAALQAGLRVIQCWDREREADPTVSFDRVVVSAFDPADLVDDVFTPIARYGAGDLSVSVQLQRALGGLARAEGPLGVAAQEMADRSLERCRGELQHPDDLRRVEAAHQR